MTFSIKTVASKDYEKYKSSRTDHWFILGATSAFVLGEDYDHRGNVCSTLYRNTVSLTKQWGKFYRGRRVPKLTVEGRLLDKREVESHSGHRSGCFYTGGVDSSFTLAERRSEISAIYSCVFDVEHNDVEKAYAEQFKATATQQENVLVPDKVIVAANFLRPFAEFGDAWSYLTHGAAISSVAHMYSGLCSHAIISSSHEYGNLIPWGSHPLTDPLLSSAGVTIEHFGASCTRFEKVENIARDPEALSSLMVCGAPYHNKNGRLNCSRCQKCLRTMTALDLAGAEPDLAKSFDWSEYSSDAISRTKLYHLNEYIFFEELKEVAKDRGRTEIYSAVSSSLRKSTPYKPVAIAEGYLRRSFPILTSRSPWLKKVKRAIVR